MAIPANTYDTYGGRNSIREDLHDIIFNISPTDTPVLSMAQQGSATNTLHEWLTDALDTPNGSNAQIEGDDASAEAVTPPSRLQNQTQISRKVLTLSGTEQKVNSAGSSNEFDRQMAKKGLALKRDMETIITGNQAASAGTTGATARTLRSLEAWYLDVNSNRGTGGAQGTTTLAATDATTANLRTIREDFLKDVLQKVWISGGKPDYVIAGAANKQKISGFSGNANRNVVADTKKLVAAIDVYESDFGVLQIMPDRFSRTRTVHVLESDMVSVDFLRKMEETELAKTGDSDKKMLVTEYTFRANNPLSMGVIADLK